MVVRTQGPFKRKGAVVAIDGTELTLRQLVARVQAADARAAREQEIGAEHERRNLSLGMSIRSLEVAVSTLERELAFYRRARHIIATALAIPVAPAPPEPKEGLS